NIANPAIVMQQNTPSAQPKWIASDPAINNKPALSFNGTTHFLSGGDVLNIGNNSRTYFTVWKFNNTNAGRFITKTISAGVTNRFAFGYVTGEISIIYHDNSNRNFSVPYASTNYDLFSLRLNRANTARTLMLFRSGNLLNQVNSIADVSYNFTSTNRFMIGASNTDAGNTSQGSYTN